MNERFVCVKVDREERPDVDALYMDAVQAMTGHGGWPLNVFLTPEQVPVLRRHLLPAAGAAWGCRAGSRCWAPSPRRGTPSARRSARRATGWRRGCAGGALLTPSEQPLEGASLDDAVAVLRQRLRQRQRRLGRARPSSRRPRSSSSCWPAASRDGAADAALDGRRRHLRPGRRRLRALQRRRALDGPALREDALRQRAARARVPARLPGQRRCAAAAHRRGDARLGAARDARPRGRLLQRARRRLRGRRGQVLRLDASTSCAPRWATTPTRRSPGSAPPSAATSRAPTSSSRADPSRPPSSARGSARRCSTSAPSACARASTTSAWPPGTRS